MSRTLPKIGFSAALLALAQPATAAEELAAVQIGDTQDTPTTTLDTPSSAGGRLGLTALETPASTSVIDAQVIEGRNDRTVQAVVSRSPGIVYVGNPGDGNTALSARGFTGHGSVMLLLDGNRAYTGAGTQTFPVDPWLAERIEVLRGPASVLYGEGATGAVVNVISKQPYTGDIHTRVRLGYGSDDRQQQAFDSGGSLTDTLSYRLAFNHQQTNGWMDHGEAESLALTASLRWQPSDDLAVTLAHDQGDNRPASYFGTPLVDGHLKSSLVGKNYNVRDARQHYRDSWTRLNVDWQINDQLAASNQLYHLQSRRHWRNAEQYDWDDSSGQVLRHGYFQIRHQQEQVGDRQTFTLSHSLFGLASKTVVGTEYNRIRFALANNSPYTDENGGDLVDPWHPAPGDFHSASAFSANSHSTTRTFALFAENSTQLSERWTLVTGVRRDQMHIDRSDDRADTRSDRSLDGGNWKAGLVFALTPDTSLYAQYGTSQDGVGSLISMSPSQQQYDLAEAHQTEAGIKQRFWDGRGEWTFAAYHIVKRKLLSQLTATSPTQQIGQQTSDGLEASLELALGDGWQLSGNAALVRARYDDFDEVVDGAVQSRAGNRPVDVPRRTANLWLNKAITDRVEAGAGVRYVDARYADTANTQTLPGYAVVDANIGWDVTRQMRLGLELNNLLDRRYAVSAYGSGEQWLLGEPRSMFVTLDYRL